MRIYKSLKSLKTSLALALILCLVVSISSASITTFDNYLASAKQQVEWCKTPGRTTVANGWFTGFDLAGNPGAGTLAVGNTANGLVPTDATAGFPLINAFGGSATGYLSRVEFFNTVAGRFTIADRLFHAGAYAYTAGTTSLSSQPAISARVPSSNYVGLQVWMQVTTAFVTGTAWTVHVTYTDQSGNTGHVGTDIPTMAAAALTLGRMYQLNLAAGDSGVQKIESVVVTNGGTAMTAGNFNVMILRPLWGGRVPIANGGDVHGMDRTGLPIVYAASAFDVMFCPDSTALGVPELTFDVVNY